MNADQLFSVVESAQQKAEQSFDQYKNDCIMPNDAIYLQRVMNIKSMCELISQVIEKGKEKGLSVAECFQRSIIPNKAAITSQYNYTSEAMDVLVERFG